MSPTLLLSQPSSSSLLRLPRASIRHQRTLSCAFKPAAICRPTTVAQTQQQRNQQPANDQQQHSPWPAAVMAAPLLPLLTAGAAFAEETASDAAADAAYAAAYAQDSGATDTIVTLMAGFVFVLLLLVTGGVAYLNLSAWLDDRQEQKDRETPVFTSSVAGRSAGEEEEAPKRVRVKREKRGFGGN